MSSFRDYGSKLAPPWLRGPNSKIFLEETEGEKDIQQDRARQSVLANFPDQGPADAVPLVGADRQLPQGTAETLANYRIRLRTTWDDITSWPGAGSHGSLLFALSRAGFPTGLAAGAVIIQRTKRYSYLNAGVVTFGTHTGWTFDGSPTSMWNQFGIVFGADVSGLTDGQPLADQLNALVKVWKPAKARYMGAWVVVSGSIWGWPLGVTWGAGGRLWGGVSRFITPV